MTQGSFLIGLGVFITLIYIYDKLIKKSNNL
jgi:hypothetical protein